MPKPAPIHTDSSELTVRFRSSQHISGRGFLLSYSTENHKGILTLKWKVCIILTQHCTYVASALRNPLSSCLLADPHVNRRAVAPCCGPMLWLAPSLIWMLTDPLGMFFTWLVWTKQSHVKRIVDPKMRIVLIYLPSCSSWRYRTHIELFFF